MASVNKIGNHGIQARVHRNGKVAWQQYYPLRDFKNERQAMKIARADAEKIESELPETDPAPGKTNTGIKYISVGECNRRGDCFVTIHVNAPQYGIQKSFYVGARGKYTRKRFNERLREAHLYLQTELRSKALRKAW